MGEDGFIVPKDFREFFERDPLRVRRWLTRRLHGRFNTDAILDFEQDLLLYLCTLAPDSQFRRKGLKPGHRACTDVIQCFDPVRHFGATAGRFHNFINVCLRNRLCTILARQRRNPISNPRNLSIISSELFQGNEVRSESLGEVNESYLFRQSAKFADEFRRRAAAEDPVRKKYVAEFEQFVSKTNSELLPVVHAMAQAGTLREAEKNLGIPDREFRRCRQVLRELKEAFVEGREPSRRKRALFISREKPMEPTTKVFLREELYERVWTTPMHRLAKEFGYSDVGLAKLCEKHSIPRPRLGYWRRVELGQKPERPPLPVVEQPNPYRIEISVRERISSGGNAAAREVPDVRVAVNQPVSHPVVLRSERLLRNPKEDEGGILLPRKGAAAHLRVTEATLPRALRILDAFFTALEASGMQITWAQEQNASLWVEWEQENIGFALEEILDRKAHRPTEQEEARHKRDYWWSAPKWEYQPSGLLRITLHCNETTGARRTWSERKERSLESQLGAVVVGIVALVESIKKVKAERKRWRDEFEAEQKRRREAEERQREFARRGQVIAKAADALHQSQLIRRLAVCLGNSTNLQKLNNASLTRMRELLEWCSEYANEIDPTCDPGRLLGSFYGRASVDAEP